MAETKHPDQGEGKTNSENMDNDQGTDLDYDELTFQQSQDDSGTDMDNTLEHEGNNTETPEHRPPDNNTNKMETKTTNQDEVQNQTRRSQRRHNTPDYRILAGKNTREKKQNDEHHQTPNKDKTGKRQRKKCVECTKHRKETREAKRENKHLKDTIRTAEATERDISELEREHNRDVQKNLNQQNAIDDLEAQTDDNLLTIRYLNEENQTAKTQNRELKEENESLKTEIENLKQHIEDMKEANRSNRRNNTPNTENATTEIEEILLLTDSSGTRVMEHITNRKKIKHITTYRMEDVVAYTKSRKHLNRPVYIMVGTNDILDGKPAEDLLETLTNWNPTTCNTK